VIALQRLLQDHEKAEITTCLTEEIAAHGQPADPAWSALALSTMRKIEW